MSELTPGAWYKDACEHAGFVSDSAQLAAVAELDVLWRQLVDFKQKRDKFLGRSLLSPDVPRGLYIWGGVGRGKTFLMDGFYHCLPFKRKRRIHFHSFMSEVHQRMKLFADQSDPLMALADQIATETRLLCLDELHVDDITDAMILGRLFAALFKRGLVLLTTSNFSPDGLYPDGLQRQNFLPAIELLKHELKVLHFEGSSDYRMLQLAREAVFMEAGNDARMNAMFDGLSSGEDVGLPRIAAVRVAKNAIWFDFKTLCGGCHDQSDYLMIARRYATVFLSDVPPMTAENAAEARRFTWLIDVLYDNKIRLIASFCIPVARLYEQWDEAESQRIQSRLTEMQSRRYLDYLIFKSNS